MATTKKTTQQKPATNTHTHHPPTSANGSIATLQRELHLLRAGGGGGSSGAADAGAGEGGSTVLELTRRAVDAEAEAARQRTAVAQLTAQWEHTLATQSAAAKEVLEQTQAELEAAVAARKEAEEELASRPQQREVEALRERLKALEALHYNVEVEEGECVCSAAALPGHSSHKPLNRLDG